MGFLGRTFGSDTWRRLAYATVAAPLGVAALALTAAGRPARAHALQAGPARRLLGAPAPAPIRPRTAGSVAYGLLSVPLGLVGLWLALAIVPNTVRNLLYGLVVDDHATAWGGPGLAGAWAVHAAGALALVPVGLWLVRGLTALQRRLADRLLGTGRLPPALAVACGLVVVLGGAFLAAWVRQV